MRTLVPLLWAAFYILYPFPCFSDDIRVLSERLNDFLEIKGEDLQVLQGKPLEKLELLVMKEGKLIPIPFQVDERVVTEKGRLRWALPKGPKGNDVIDDGFLDADDELVFMSRDLGTKAHPEVLRGFSLPAIEIQITDPLTGERGYAYFHAASETPRRSDEDYVYYDFQNDYIETPVYTVGHSKIFPIAHNENTIKPEAGGEGVDFLDIFKQRLFATMFFGTVKFDKRAQDWESCISAYKDGPVRVVRRNENRLFIAGNIKSPRLYTTSFYLRETFWIPGELDIPFKLSIVFTKVEVAWANDLTRNAIGMKYFSNGVPNGVLIDGIMSPEEQNITPVEHVWQMITGSQGTLLTRAVLGPRAKDIPHLLTYTEDASAEDPPEEEPGIYGKAGFKLTQLEKQEGGIYTSSAHNYFRGDYKPGDEKRLLNILDHPLQVKTNTLSLEESGRDRL